MKCKLSFFINILIANTCLGGFLAPTISKLALSNTGLVSSITASLFKNSKLCNIPASFKTSKEQEFADFVKYEQKHRAIFKDKSSQEVESIILANLNKFKQKSVITPFSQISHFNNHLDINDMQRTFDFLKQKINVPDEIKLYHIQNDRKAAMSYNPVDRVIYTNNDIFSQNPSITLYQYIHELFHAQQHQQKGLLEFTVKTPRALLEHDADAKATEFIKCPLCMKVILAHYLKLPEQGQLYLKSLGNFNAHDFKKSLEQKSLKNLCCAHQSVKNPDIWSDLDTPEGCKKIQANDYTLGSMLNRIS